MSRNVFIVLSCLLLTTGLLAQDDARTVIGPDNVDLYDGAQALMAGDAEAGVRLTLSGLGMANTRKERLTAFGNLCAGYVLLDELDTALDYCNRALEISDRHWRSYSNRALIFVKKKRYSEAEADIRAGLELAPNSRQLKVVRSMLLDATDPVTPRIIIDDRRQGPGA